MKLLPEVDDGTRILKVQTGSFGKSRGSHTNLIVSLVSDCLYESVCENFIMKLRGKGFHSTRVMEATFFSLQVEGLVHTARFFVQVYSVSNPLCASLCKFPDETRDTRASWNTGYWAKIFFLELEGLAQIFVCFGCCLLLFVVVVLKRLKKQTIRFSSPIKYGCPEQTSHILHIYVSKTSQKAKYRNLTENGLSTHIKHQI